MSPHLTALLKSIPKTPGIYRMRDAKGVIIYVGKSVSLYSRVNSYFKASTDLNAAKISMVSKIRDLDWIETTSDTEALILETNLIKELKPKYNVLMKDDKNLAWIAVSDGTVGEVVRVRNKVPDATLAGPFTTGSQAWESARALRKAFRVRSCRMRFATEKGKTIITAKAGKVPPCLDYHIGLCPAPCLLTDKALNEHKENVERLKAFLKGKSQGLIENLTSKMNALAQEKRFEEAAKIRDQITSLQGLSEKQVARAKTDITGMIAVGTERYGKCFTTLVTLREGQIVAVRNTTLISALDESFEERWYVLLSSVIIEMQRGDTLLLAEWIQPELYTLAKEQGIEIQVPEIGEKKELVTFARTNLLRFAQREELDRLSHTETTRQTMANILQKLGLEVPTKGEITFEGYDISHTDGRFTQAARVIIANGKPDPSRYRRYKIQSLADGVIDDYQSHREVSYRRTLEGVEKDNFPTLIVIDGGKWQLSSAIKWAQEGMQFTMNRTSEEYPHWETRTHNQKLAPIVSIAKREEEVFVPWQSEPILFEKGSPELRLLQKLRDESHRFSITGNRKARSKAMVGNLLDELPWIGPTTRKKLLKLAGSIDAIRTLSEDVVLAVVTATQLETLRDHGLYE